MASRERQKRIVSNTAYTIGGALLMNGVLQILVYPLLNRFMGSDQLGELLYLMGLVAILCPSVGQALNTSRLVVRRDYEVANGDYNILLLFFGGIGTAVSLFVAKDSMTSVPVVLWTVVLLMTTIFRYYGDVEYRLNLNYRRYFCYYAVLTAGYVAGFGVYLVTKNWFLVFVTGEAASLVYLAVTGTVFHGFFRRSPWFGKALERGGFLVFSYLITNLTLNIDRLALEHMIGHLAVTQYYVTSLIGKTLVLLVAPVNTIIISYLTRKQERMAGSSSYVYRIGLGVSFVFFPWFPDRNAAVRLAVLWRSVRICKRNDNGGQYKPDPWRAVGLSFYRGADLHRRKMAADPADLPSGADRMPGLIFTEQNGIMGFAAAVLIANAVRVAAVIFLGLWKSGRT